ncbi:hypothetical protein Golax_003472, partial [Gossypium laxum]|nr:hypothetical protein [Gossypium laxum]
MELATSFISGAQLNLLCPKNLTTSTSRSYKLPKRTKFLSLHSLLLPPFSNAFICQGSSFGFINNSTSTSSTNSNISNRFYKRLDSCLIIPPSRNRKPRAIIKFLGGAFLGAVPEVTYRYLVFSFPWWNQNKEGFLIISVPYNVTFDHEQATKQVYERFNACLDNILAFGYPDANLTPADLVNLPLFSVGHSNGALLQVLTGSYFSEKIPKANAIISYNNKSATEAVPYFEQLGPLVRQMMPMVETSPMYSMARSASDDAWKMFIDTAGAMIPERDQEAFVSFTNFVDQLPSVFGQVTQGISEFKPTPSENRECCKNKYNVQHTLL